MSLGELSISLDFVVDLQHIIYNTKPSKTNMNILISKQKIMLIHEYKKLH